MEIKKYTLADKLKRIARDLDIEFCERRFENIVTQISLKEMENLIDKHRDYLKNYTNPGWHIVLDKPEKGGKYDEEYKMSMTERILKYAISKANKRMIDFLHKKTSKKTPERPQELETFLNELKIDEQDKSLYESVKKDNDFLKDVPDFKYCH